ncbi:MauE/DoxX family redox-associated membrane protein [Sphingobacterium paramultivorum]|uniref:MauE/DoxX family redox-associated membrane protein n=1 Tax=Sphingobacterium paramultivorum TaxID=2886510 RepID=UPI00129CB2BE|nr:MauE/DoxX family redox-associated membrane protein [Sphingobacterium paramultivorum]
MKIKNLITELIIFILILIWAYTFASKIFDFDTFDRQIKGAYILSAGGSVLPYILQALHLAIVIMLINKNWRRLGLLTSLSVMVIYTAYLIYILKFAPSVPCSCIAVVRGMNWNDQLYFNFIALAINIIGLITFFSLKRAPHSGQTIYN